MKYDEIILQINLEKDYFITEKGLFHHRKLDWILGISERKELFQPRKWFISDWIFGILERKMLF